VYTAGKVDWVANGLPTEGEEKHRPRARDLARRDVPVCRLTDSISNARELVRAAGWKECVVVNDERIVLGLVRGEALNTGSEFTAEQVMENGPRTVRLDASPSKVAEVMRKRGLDSVLVTTSDGKLWGVLRRGDDEP
jgi:CBS domain-containing protein